MSRKKWLESRNDEKRMDMARNMYLDRVNDMSFRQIAEKYGKSVSTVHKYINDYKPSLLEGPAMQWREHEVEKLDELESRVWKLLDKRYYRVDHGKLIRIEDEETGEETPMLDDGPLLQAVDRLIKISERRSKLLGLDRPIQAEVTHKAEVQDQELLDILNQVKTRAQEEESDIVDAVVVEDEPRQIERGSE